MAERLDKYISVSFSISRKDARNEIKKGSVTIDNTVIKDAAFKVPPKAEVTLGGKKAAYKKYIYVMLNKPRGILSASTDKQRETVVDLVYRTHKRNGLFPVGRLDKDTTGFLIVTDDGDFGHKVMSPKNMVEKEYFVKVDKPITNEDIKVLESGVTLADKTKCRPAKVKHLDNTGEYLSIVITEGKYHEIKRLLGVVGAGVISLHRHRIAGVVLDEKLKKGEFRELTDDELMVLANSLK